MSNASEDDSSSSSSNTSSSSTSKDEDLNLKMLNARRMVELRKRMNTTAAAKRNQAEHAANSKKVPTDRELVLQALTDRGDEVLASAEASYPNEMRILLPRLAALIRQGKVTTITGGELLQFFRSLGMRVSVSTSISVAEHGKIVSLAEKLKRESEG